MVAAYAGENEACLRAPVLRQALLECGDLELDSYKPVLKAASPEERSRALSTASETPLAIARAAAEVAELAAHVLTRSGPALQGDAAAAVLLAEATTRAAARLVEINLRSQPDDPRLGEVASLGERAFRARERALGR